MVSEKRVRSVRSEIVEYSLKCLLLSRVTRARSVHYFGAIHFPHGQGNAGLSRQGANPATSAFPSSCSIITGEKSI